MIWTKIFANSSQFQLETELNEFIQNLIYKEYVVLDLIYAPTDYNFTVMLVFGPPEYSVKYRGIKL